MYRYFLAIWAFGWIDLAYSVSARGRPEHEMSSPASTYILVLIVVAVFIWGFAMNIRDRLRERRKKRANPGARK